MQCIVQFVITPLKIYLCKWHRAVSISIILTHVYFQKKGPKLKSKSRLYFHEGPGKSLVGVDGHLVGFHSWVPSSYMKKWKSRFLWKYLSSTNGFAKSWNTSQKDQKVNTCQRSHHLAPPCDPFLSNSSFHKPPLFFILNTFSGHFSNVHQQFNSLNILISKMNHVWEIIDPNNKGVSKVLW